MTQGHHQVGLAGGTVGSEELHDVADLTPEDEALDLGDRQGARAPRRLRATSPSRPQRSATT